MWGGGRDLILEIDQGTLKLVDQNPPCITSSMEGDTTRHVLNTQPIHTIRVWGVGRDNGKDFAYVARDKHTRKVKLIINTLDSNIVIKYKNNKE